MRASLLLLLGLVWVGTAGAEDTGIIQNEYAFAQAVAEHGIRDGFLAYLDPEAIGFTPTPMKSYESYKSRPASKSKLSWYPTDALLADSGDFGFTTGPWTLSYDLDGKTQTASGDFVTLWHRRKDGRWLALLDAGIDHSVPAIQPIGLTKDAAPRKLAKPDKATDAVKTKDALLKADKAFSGLVSGTGLRAAYARMAADDLRLLEEGKQPAVSKDVALRILPEDKITSVWVPSGEEIATSGDLGYTYGLTFDTADTGHASPQTSYLHVWERDKDGWKLVLALESPVPPPPAEEPVQDTN